MEDKVGIGVVQTGLAKMMPNKFGVTEKVEKVKATKAELTKDRSKNKKVASTIKCEYCKKIVPKGNYCDQCGKPQKK